MVHWSQNWCMLFFGYSQQGNQNKNFQKYKLETLIINLQLQEWTFVFDLKKARALATGLVTTTGSFYITGGYGQSKILNSVEIITFNGVRWSLKKGKKMPEPLAGHCMAEISATKFAIAGGFSNSIDDYISTLYIFDQDTSEWTTRPWMAMSYGPRFDHSCMILRSNDEKYILSAGGWNNSAMPETELFQVSEDRWMPVKRKIGVDADGNNKYEPSFSKGVRSNKLAIINHKPFMAGGIECDGYVVQ